MKKHEILENIRIDKLIFGGSGLALAPDGMKIIITGGAIPESVVDLRITRVHKNRYDAQILRTRVRSPYERDLPSGWQIYGGCKWLPIPYENQLEIKENQIREAFHILKEYTSDTTFHPIIPSPEQRGYRNKVEFSWGKYISEKEGVHDDFRFGFHAPAQFDRIIDCEYCVLADEEINAIFRDIDVFSRNSSFPTYDPKMAIGFWRHLVIRKAKKTNQIMLIWSLNTSYNPEALRFAKVEIKKFSEVLSEKYPHIHSVYLFHNTGRADIVTGEEECILGESYITETLLGKTFEIQPKSFFQTNSLGAETLYQKAIDFCPQEGGFLLDLYGGTGTIGILLAERFQKVYSVELVTSASEDGRKNALRNQISNIEFINEKTEDFLPKFLEVQKMKDRSLGLSTLIVDPPRDGMHSKACENLLNFQAQTIIYVSCNPATLVRDLTILLDSKEYRLTDIAPMDMFPHTHHIETVVHLERVDSPV